MHERRAFESKLNERLDLVGDRIVSETVEVLEYNRKVARFLSKVPPIQGLVRAHANGGYDALENSTSEIWEKRLNTIFRSFLESNPSTYQVRYIGVAHGGRELIRVERRGGEVYVVPQSLLQAKGKRDYFRETLALKPGDVYISDVTLNREHGLVQRPHLPSVRIGTPVYDYQGRPFGVIVINIDLRELLTRLTTLQAEGSAYAMNSSGDFLAHPQPGKTFGFDLGRRYLFQDEFFPEEQRLADFHFATAKQGVELRGKDDQMHAVIKHIELQAGSDRAIHFAAMLPDAIVRAAVRERIILSSGILTGLCAALLASLYFYWLGVQRRLETHGERVRLAEVVDTANDAIIGVDLDGTVISWNSSATRLFGYTNEEALARSVHELIAPPGEEIDVKEGLVRFSQDSRALETKRRRKDGSCVDVAMTMGALHDAQGSVVGAAKVLRDISEQKKHQESIEKLNSGLEALVDERTAALAASSALQKAILTDAGYAVIATDVQGLITLFNPAAERLLGYKASELVHRASPAKFHLREEVEQRGSELSEKLGKEVKGFEAFIAEVSPGHPEERDWTYIHRDGRRIPIRLQVTALGDDHDEVMGYLGIAIDQTAVLEREAEIKEAHAQAQAANQAKSQFLANMSHEIRTPMNAVQGMLQLLRRTPLTSKQQDYTSKAQSAAKTLLSILNDVLDFSKIEAGKMSLNPERFRLDTMLREMGAMIAATLGGKDVDLLYDIAPSTPSNLVGDALRLQQVLLNLISNALKFTENGEVVVSIEALDAVGEETTLLFSVRDTGIGMSPEQLDRIFRSFEQAEASTTRKFGGTGLGLTISRRLVHLMGGELVAESTHGQGSTFSFTARFVRSTVEEDTLPLVPSNSTLRELRTLVIDDNPAARDIISRVAGSLGWKATAVPDVEEALRRLTLEGERLDLILVDRRMLSERTTGPLDTVRELLPEVTILALNQGVIEGHQQAFQLDGVVLKPLTGSSLFDAVATVRAPSSRASRLRSELPPALRLNGIQLLLVEDVPVNQQIATELLKGEGAEVDVASSGIEALEQLRKAPDYYDLILMDVQMPDLDGYETTGKIRGSLGLTEIPIIAMTANAMRSDKYACLAAGMNDHIGKPFHIDDVVARILQFVQTKTKTKTKTTPLSPPPSVQPPPKSEVAGEFAFAEALARLGGNEKLLKTQAGIFCATYERTIEELEHLIEKGELHECALKLHALKGVSATLGATGLSHAARELEASAKEGIRSPRFDAVFESFALVFRGALKELSRFAQAGTAENDNGPNRRAPEPAAASLQQGLDELASLLEKRNMAALGLHESLEASLREVNEGLSKELEGALSVLDFTEARRLCLVFHERVA